MADATKESVSRAFRGRTPFWPFTVALANGHRFEVDRADALVVRDGVAIFVALGGAPVMLDHDAVSQIEGNLSAGGPAQPAWP